MDEQFKEIEKAWYHSFSEWRFDVYPLARWVHQSGLYMLHEIKRLREENEQLKLLVANKLKWKSGEPEFADGREYLVQWGENNRYCEHIIIYDNDYVEPAYRIPANRHILWQDVKNTIEKENGSD